jgi:capsid protein
VYGTDRRLGEVRGVPLLGIVLQSLKEIDRYRDSAQRKAVINSMLAMFVKKSEDKPGTRPISAGATRRDSVAVTDPSGAKRQFNIQKSVPGMVMEELQHGEEPVAFGANGTDVNFGPFEEAMLQSVAWANEMPPEIMRLAFSSNYSASQAALNEFKIYLNKIWSTFGANFCRPVYQDWLINENLAGRVVSPGLLDAWRDPTKITQFTSWTDADWYGSIKPSTDMKKLVQASKLALDEGWTTNSRESRAITGTKFTKNAKRLKRENELKVEAMTPLAEFKKEYGFGVEQTEEETT